ncbi:Aldo/keto reductase [Epithele typhae]|uniref:Aldo/keto reductase n=1 Tax=Epithele typhae TaxID=378194 RepID=UPI002007D7EB|nr:Aldo/keto reductase [Epithele typhae]KAH9932092.1 Aldo/keto reductase [Epithele typhae]
MPFTYEPKNMLFRRLGPSGLRVPVFSLGAWLTYGETVNGDPVKEIIKTALENGVNMFDTAEGYAAGKAELEMGRVFKELDVLRSDIVVTTKIFWGGKGPNDTGLSRKHIIEGTKKCLERLQMDYVDVLFAHRPDHTVPMEEVVLAFNYVIDQGWAFYWGTSEWSAQEVEEAYHVAAKLGLVAPIAEQCQHNMFHRERPEKEYAPLYEKHSIGTTAYSPLARGVLTGKYNGGVVPEDSRFAVHSGFFNARLERFKTEEGKKEFETVKQLSDFAGKELGCSITHLALAWLAASPNTHTVILGASKPEQVLDNLKALDVIPKMTPEVMDKIEKILDNKPTPWSSYGRPKLDTAGKSLMFA